MQILPVLLAGGLGKRLLPFSTEMCPKQFLYLLEGKISFFQSSVLKMRKIFANQQLVIVCNQRNVSLIRKQLSAIKEANYLMLVENERRNTFGAVLFGLKYAEMYNYTHLFICTCDAYIENEIVFAQDIGTACKTCLHCDKHICFGLPVLQASENYGYIQIGERINVDKNKDRQEEFNDVFYVNRFIEKPTYELAKKFFKDNGYLWNSGFYIFNISTLIEEVRQYEPYAFDVYKKMEIQENRSNKCVMSDDFSKINNISIDIAIVQKSKKMLCCIAHFDWCDVGSITIFKELLSKGKIHLFD